MSSATDPLDTPHSDSDSERTPAASLPDYGDPTSARSPDDTLLVGTHRTATLATGGELFSDAHQRPPDATVHTDTFRSASLEALRSVSVMIIYLHLPHSPHIYETPLTARCLDAQVGHLDPSNGQIELITGLRVWN